MKKWENLPESLKTEEIKPYYKALKSKGFSLFLKRTFDIFASAVLIILLSPVMLVLAVMIKCDSKGPVFYKSVRVTRYNKDFKIYKFRTMVTDADKKGSLITVSGDSRITRVGAKIRGSRLDEIPQLFTLSQNFALFFGSNEKQKRSLFRNSFFMFGFFVGIYKRIYIRDHPFILTWKQPFHNSCKNFTNIVICQQFRSITVRIHRKRF